MEKQLMVCVGVGDSESKSFTKGKFYELTEDGLEADNGAYYEVFADNSFGKTLFEKWERFIDGFDADFRLVENGNSVLMFFDVEEILELDFKEKPFVERVTTGDKYYFIDEMGDVQSYKFSNDYIDKTLLESGNFFETDEEAKEYELIVRKRGE